MKYQLLLAALVASATAELPPLEKWKYTGVSTYAGKGKNPSQSTPSIAMMPA